MKRLAFEGLKMGSDTGQPDAPAAFGVNLVSIRWHEGRLDQIMPLIVQGAADYPGLPAFQAGYAVALMVGGALCSDLDTITSWPIVALWAAALGIGVYATYLRYRTAGAVERRRIQWIGWGMTVAAEAVLVVIALRLLTDWPHSPGTVALAVTGLVPIAIIAGTLPKMVARVDRLLTHTVSLAGLTALVLAVYVIVVTPGIIAFAFAQRLFFKGLMEGVLKA